MLILLSVLSVCLRDTKSGYEKCIGIPHNEADQFNQALVNGGGRTVLFNLVSRESSERSVYLRDANCCNVLLVLSSSGRGKVCLRDAKFSSINLLAYSSE